MKILLVSNCSFNENQGSGYAISHYYLHGLRKLGVQVDAYEPDQYESFRFLRPYANSYRQALGMLLLVIRKFLFKKYDVVVFYGAESFAGIWFLQKVLKTKTLVVHHSNGIENHSMDVIKEMFEFATVDNKPPKWYQFDRYNLFLKSFKYCDVLITNGFYDKEYAEVKLLRPSNKVYSIDLGIDKIFLGQDFDFEKQKIVIYCGTWIARKGIDIIQHDMSLFLETHPEYKFYIVGCGDTFKKEEHFSSSVLDRVVVCPFLKDKQELKKLYQQSEIVLFPSYYDSFGLVLAEAMACSCVPVCNATGYAFGLKHLEEAFQMAENKKGELSKALNVLLEDSDLRKKIAKGAYQRVQNLDWDIQVNNLAQVLQKEVENKSKSCESFS